MKLPTLFCPTFSLLGLLICLCLPLQGQDRGLFWKLEPLPDARPKEKRLLKKLSQSGYQLDPLALQQGEVVLLFDKLPVLGASLNRRQSSLQLLTETDSTSSLDREALRAQLYPQYQERSRGTTNQRRFRKALKGKQRSLRAAKAPYRLQVGQAPATATRYTLAFYRKKKPFALLHFQALPGQQITGLPYLEFSNCSPFDRASYFQDISRRWYAGTAPYPYTPALGIARRKRFGLLFEKNMAAPDPEDVKTIRAFLTDTLYVIDKAEIRAWASVEGSLENNSRLQEKRAEILIRALEQQQGDSIPYTVHTEENWALFFDQLQRRGLDSTYRSREEWKEFFLSKEEQERWEPLLARQRKAELWLELLQKLTGEQQQQLAFGHFQKLAFRYQQPGQRRAGLIKAMLGIRNYLQAEVEAGRLQAERLCSLRPQREVYEYSLIHFYEQAERFERGQQLLCDFEALALETFTSIQNRYELQYIQHLQGKPRPDAKVYGDLVSVQAYIFQKIIEGKFSPRLACALRVPEDPRYYHLYLNYLKFTNALRDYPALDVDCRQESASAEVVGDAFDWRAIDADSRYYYLLKRMVLEGHRLEGVWRTDWMVEFDRFEFLQYNILNWNPDTGQFFDRDIGVAEMAAQTSSLLKSLRHLCPHQAYGLAIAFHAKVVQQAYGQQQPSRQLEESLAFIERFYIRHAAALSPQQATHIVQQLLMANSYSLRNERGRFAMDLLERVGSRKGLTHDQQALYQQLAASMGVNPKL
ncbi:hypothetical protein [Cesiribacter andamanensis]|uniref:Uncharacterized protein n=1 Tax=Cesiribacter andamanensis AMV16 TaxID=1279009 RepID=M7P060_9BACT|nr:hypothetical protein [Cesiribacter andamanensis]EMR04004.1 hypothetical protein ADICEAN_00875 [Cesiribacter andamanensis AMV16]